MQPKLSMNFPKKNKKEKTLKYSNLKPFWSSTVWTRWVTSIWAYFMKISTWEGHYRSLSCSDHIFTEQADFREASTACGPCTPRAQVQVSLGGQPVTFLLVLSSSGRPRIKDTHVSTASQIFTVLLLRRSAAVGALPVRQSVLSQAVRLQGGAFAYGWTGLPGSSLQWSLISSWHGPATLKPNLCRLQLKTAFKNTSCFI